MPTYEYQCQNCGHEFELFQQMTESVKKKCPECEKLKLKRLIGAGSAVVFKGSGFYETDYRSNSYKKDAKAEKESRTPKKDSTKKDSKKPKEKSPSPKKG
ncbi:MAG: zinc ribbon domain-containing protein [Phycisphaerales bacterium]|nr:zinc ribbon domain-containing protein [Planctomycetota bacterium]MBL6996979.1 zinc ribbon domain-containing protein [Phycisphaerales bacterium]